MKIIMDTDKKTITVPYNYTEKLAEINRIAHEFGGRDVEEQTPLGYLERMWRDCMAEPDKRVVTGKKPNRSTK